VSRRRRRLQPVILAHGGAGARVVTTAHLAGLADALATGYGVLRRGGSAITAVEAAIKVLEGSGLFNAGTGARLQLDGIRRMDASIMEGRALRAGAVAGIEQVRHPISAARLVMEKTAHVLLIGEHATRFARHFKLARQTPIRRNPAARHSAKRNASREAVTAAGPRRRMLRLYEKLLGLETVGAVALDPEGNVAAGASTGGIAFMLPGRVGDSPLVGCGIYADNEAGAVSMTGLGESIIRLAMAKEITDRLARGASPDAAARLTFAKLVQRLKGIGAGALVLAPDGRFAIRHTTPTMCAGWWAGTDKPVVRDRFNTES
jgi:beta-aspartyl-peptidase (threonine type)